MLEKQHTRKFDNLNNEGPIIFNEVFGFCMGMRQQQQLVHLSFLVAYCPLAEKILACPGTYGKQLQSPSDVPSQLILLCFAAAALLQKAFQSLNVRHFLDVISSVAMP